MYSVQMASKYSAELGAGVLVEARVPTDLPRDATNRSVHTPRNHSVVFVVEHNLHQTRFLQSNERRAFVELLHCSRGVLGRERYR